MSREPRRSGIPAAEDRPVEEIRKFVVFVVCLKG